MRLHKAQEVDAWLPWMHHIQEQLWLVFLHHLDVCWQKWAQHIVPCTAPQAQHYNLAISTSIRHMLPAFLNACHTQAVM